MEQSARRRGTAAYRSVLVPCPRSRVAGIVSCCAAALLFTKSQSKLSVKRAVYVRHLAQFWSSVINMQAYFTWSIAACVAIAKRHRYWHVPIIDEPATLVTLRLKSRGIDIDSQGDDQAKCYTPRAVAVDSPPPPPLSTKKSRQFFQDYLIRLLYLNLGLVL